MGEDQERPPSPEIPPENQHQILHPHAPPPHHGNPMMHPPFVGFGMDQGWGPGMFGHHMHPHGPVGHAGMGG